MQEAPMFSRQRIRFVVGISVLGCTWFCLAAITASSVDAYDGDLDPGFAGNGIMGIAMGTGDGWGRSIAVQSDGMYVIAGTATNLNEDIGIARVTPIGSMDTFGSAGKVIWNSGWGSDDGWAAAVQKDGKIVVVGTSRLESASHLTALRFNSGGSPDTSFGNNGTLIVDFGVNSHGRALAIQPDGKIVMVGGRDDYIPAIARLDDTGNLDPTFGTGGLFTDTGLPLLGDREAWDVALFPTGHIAVVGSMFTPAVPPIRPEDVTWAYLLITDSDGSTFSQDLFDFGGDSEARGVTIQPDGKIVIAGFSEVNTSIAVARVLANGNFDTSFSGDGLYTVDYGEGIDEGWALTRQPDGKIVVAGSATIDGLVQAVVFRLSDDGSLDKFGPIIGNTPQGYNAFVFGTESRARSVAYAYPTGLVVAGEAVAQNGRSVYLAAQLEVPSLEKIFSDGFESGGFSFWSGAIQ
jgi:uncharacterized delta-60 repeat protein